MNIRTFWTLFLKILGIWLILCGLTLIPQFISAFAFFKDNHQDNLFATIYFTGVLLLAVVIYFVILKLLVFNPNWLIDKLKLDKGFQEERLDLNITLKAILTVATIVIGGLIFIDALPMLCRQIFTFVQQKSVLKEDPQFNLIVFYSVKALIGYLLMTNSRLVVDFINKKAE